MRLYIFFVILSALSLQISYGQLAPADSMLRHKRFPVASDTLVKTQTEEIEQLKKDILSLDRELANTQLNLAYHYKEYKTGTILKLGGAAVFALGVILAVSSSHRGHTRGTRTGSSAQALAIPLIGALGFVAGEILCIHSHKYIGKASKRIKRSNQ